VIPKHKDVASVVVQLTNIHTIQMLYCHLPVSHNSMVCTLASLAAGAVAAGCLAAEKGEGGEVPDGLMKVGSATVAFDVPFAAADALTGSTTRRNCTQLDVFNRTVITWVS
jgi:hypothetical protein